MKYKLSLERRKKNGKVVVENVPIRIVVTHNYKRITLSTGFRVDFKSWNEQQQVVRRGVVNKQGEPFNFINSNISEQTAFIDNYAVKKRVDNEEIDLQELKVEFAERFARKQNISHKDEVDEETRQAGFFELFDMFVKERGKLNDWTPATYTKFKAVRKHLYDFDKNITFEKLTVEVLSDYVSFLRDSCNFKNSTIKKNLGFFKWFLNWSVEKGHNTNMTYKNFKPKLKTAEKHVVYLTKEELDILRNYEIPEQKQYLDRVRDVFLFSCYTSLRYSDVKELKHSNIKGDVIEIVTKKTTDKLRIKLNNKAQAIIAKYKDIAFENGKVLPVISNQKMNDYLKELGKLAGINDPVTDVYFMGNQRFEDTHPKYQLIGTHTGRRTFICNALLNGMPPHAVMKITGHSDYKAMKPYIDIVSKEVDNMVEKYIDF